MGMSTHVVGFKPPDEKWERLRAVWDAYAAAGVRPPAEVGRFFQGESPDAHGVEVTTEQSLEECGALHEWADFSREGYEINVSKLPSDVTVIRFYNSY